MPTKNLSVKLGSLRLPNPILTASGTFGYAKEAAGLYDLSRLGGIIPKTISFLMGYVIRYHLSSLEKLPVR